MIPSNRLQHCCFRFFQFVMTFPHSFSLLLASFRIISFSECHSEKAEWERESWMINLKSRAHIYSIFLWEGGVSAQLLDMLSEMVLSETRLQLKLLVYWNVWLVNGPLVFDGACNASWSKLEFFEAYKKKRQKIACHLIPYLVWPVGVQPNDGSNQINLKSQNWTLISPLTFDLPADVQIKLCILVTLPLYSRADAATKVNISQFPKCASQWNQTSFQM